ncbi:hypothetical protein [Pseudomonas phage PH826]|uniref:Uncharacterized protein n=2 Tax=Nankokuvirus PAKP3 TaxID=1925782 RepID=F2W690_9CAUD|nr:hypothetical protein PAK_P30096 [Pseudomonas phage PAK_P3]ADX32110.1 hypothetical protein P3_CHA0097 [Pseudomonas phage P3_CHA]ADX32295.1 hypothetical protein PAK_P30096 [Pseudomonas phage PAK_P3]UVD32790.1 hypothetical protein [Pseudomonas phage PH826]
MATHKAIRDTLSAVTSLAFAEVERLAREVFREDPNCMNFCMAMGSASFYREWIDCNDPDGDWPMNEYLSAEEVYEMSGSQAAKHLDSLLTEFGEALRLTGHPLKLTRMTEDSILRQTDW